jgi:hypothetical protein
VILETLSGSVQDYRAFVSILKRYDIRECIIIADRGLVSNDMPKSVIACLILIHFLMRKGIGIVRTEGVENDKES